MMMDQVTSGGETSRHLVCNSVTSGHRPTWHSTPFVSPALCAPSLPHCAERHAVLRQPALLALTRMESLKVKVYAGTWSRCDYALDIQSSLTNIAGSRGHRGGWCSEVKEESRAKPGSGDTNGTIYPGALGPHKPSKTNSHAAIHANAKCSAERHQEPQNTY